MASRAKPQNLFATAPDLRAEVARARSLRELISDKLASLVVSGILHVGDELPGERELASAFAVSRESVRGALQTLAAKGIIEIAQGSRTRVVSAEIDALNIGVASPSAINAYDLESVHHARLLVERAVAAEAALRIDEATLARLHRSLEVQKQTMSDPVHFLICDREFHLAIYQSAGNPLLADFVTNLYTFMLDHRRVAVSQPGAIEKSYRDHVAIVEALQRRDPRATSAAFKRHIDRIYSTTFDLLAKRTKRAFTPDDPAQGRRSA